MLNNRKFTIIDNNGEKLELIIKDPSLKEREEAESVRIKAWNAAIKSGAIFTEKLNDILKEQGIWDDVKDQKLADLRIEVADNLDKLNKGGIKLSDAKKVALRVRELRTEINVLTFDRLRYITNTVENISSDKEFGCLVSHMVYYDENRRYFKDYSDYLNRAQDTDVYQINSEVANILYGGQDSFYPEIKFLKEFKFVDDELRFINKEGHLCDADGRLINSDGNYIKYDENNKEVIIDIDGNPIEVLQRKPFLDDNGNEIKDTSNDKQEEKTEDKLETAATT